MLILLAPVAFWLFTPFNYATHTDYEYYEEVIFDRGEEDPSSKIDGEQVYVVLFNEEESTSNQESKVNYSHINKGASCFNDNGYYHTNTAVFPSSPQA